jgi:ParB/RepB/Spo0J family partition protein
MTTQAPADIYLDADDYRIDPRALMPSPTNRTINRGAEDIHELADNIQAVGGIMQPLLIRPLPDKYRSQAQPGQEFEIVAGERRWHAAMLLNLAEVPARIARLTDAQVVTMQASENIQRKGYTPIEQAQALDHMRAAGMHVSDIAKQLGKSTAHVYAKLKLLDLAPESQDALRSGLIDESAAVPLSRLPASIQPKALAEITGYRDVEAGERYPTRQQIVMLQRDYTRKLVKAVFDIALTDLIETAGDCHTCPSRAGNQPDSLIGSMTCTNPECYEAKTSAHNIRLLNLPEGIKRVEIPRANPASATTWTDYDAAGYRVLTGQCPSDKQHYKRTYADYIKDHGLHITQPAIHVDPVTQEVRMLATCNELAALISTIVEPTSASEAAANTAPEPVAAPVVTDAHIGIDLATGPDTTVHHEVDTRDDYTLYNLAVEHIKKTGIPSVSGVQRELRISYQKALNTFEQMTKAGILNHDPRRASPYTIATKDNELAQAQALRKACEQNPPMLIAQPLTRLIADALTGRRAGLTSEQDCIALIVHELAQKAYATGTDELVALATALNVDVAEIQRTYPTADTGIPASPPEAAEATPAPSTKPAKRATVQFAHPENRAIGWSGHGRKPQWVLDWLASGKPLEDLRVAGQQTFA